MILIVLFLLDITNSKRCRSKPNFFIHEKFTSSKVISLVKEKCYEDYLPIFDYVMTTFTLPLSLECACNTYVDLSTGFVEGNVSKILKSVGQGLFAKKFLKKGSVIDYFIGVLRSAVEYDTKVSQGYGGYGIYLNKLCVLDCYGNLTCKCSMANSPLGVSVDCTRRVVQSNASLHVDGNRCGCVKLIAESDIDVRTEIFYDYESSFIFPDINEKRFLMLTIIKIFITFKLYISESLMSYFHAYKILFILVRFVICSSFFF